MGTRKTKGRLPIVLGRHTWQHVCPAERVGLSQQSTVLQATTPLLQWHGWQGSDEMTAPSGYTTPLRVQLPATHDKKNQDQNKNLSPCRPNDSYFKDHTFWNGLSASLTICYNIPGLWRSRLESDCGSEGMGFDHHSGQSKVRLFSLPILTDKIVLVVQSCRVPTPLSMVRWCQYNVTSRPEYASVSVGVKQ
jgi:hypothetical protein